MNLKEIKELLQLMADHDLSEIELEKDGLKIKLKKGTGGRVIAEGFSPVPTVLRPIEQMPAAPSLVMAAGQESTPPNVYTGRSPMVGTFYAAPAPDQPPYVTLGAQIKEGEVLCILEAMKLMNEIKSEVSGEVIEILAKNGQPIEFDQPLFRIRTG